MRTNCIFEGNIIDVWTYCTNMITEINKHMTKTNSWSVDQINKHMTKTNIDVWTIVLILWQRLTNIWQKQIVDQKSRMLLKDESILRHNFLDLESPWGLIQAPHFLKKIYFIYFWLHWVYIVARGLSLVAASGGYSWLQCAGFSLWWLLLLRSMGSRCVGFSSCSTLAQ